jgi:polyhydroxyalkanoate synthesis repressor PhaR
VTLADIRQLVIGKVDFVVVDRKTDEDITRSILLQVISEQEQHGEPVMSQDFLSQVIRSYGKVVPELASGYLEESMKFFMTGQQNLRSQIKRVVGVDPFSIVADAAHKNFARWKSLQDEVLRRFASVGRIEDGAPENLPAKHEKAL